MVKFISAVFLRYSTVRDLNISKPDGTVQYGKGTVPVLVLYGSVLYHSVGAIRTMNLLFYGKMKIDPRSESTHDLSRSHIHPLDFGLKWLGYYSLEPISNNPLRTLYNWTRIILNAKKNTVPSNY